MRTTYAIALLVLLSCGCVTQRSKPVAAALSPRDVLLLADSCVKKKRVESGVLPSLPGSGRSAKYDARTRAWWVQYGQVTSATTGMSFGVIVDDATCETQYFGGQ